RLQRLPVRAQARAAGRGDELRVRQSAGGGAVRDPAGGGDGRAVRRRRDGGDPGRRGGDHPGRAGRETQAQSARALTGVPPGRAGCSAPVGARWPGSLDGDGALHERGVAREAAEEHVTAAALHRAGGEGDRGVLAAADDLGVRDDTVVVLRDVVVVRAGGQAVGGDALHVGFRGDHDVVAHRGLRQLAGVLEVDGEFAARGRDRDRIDVELHRVVALDRGLAAGDLGRVTRGRGGRPGVLARGTGVGRSGRGGARRGGAGHRVGAGIHAARGGARRGTRTGGRGRVRRRGGVLRGRGVIAATGGKGQHAGRGKQGRLDVHGYSVWTSRRT